MPKNLILLALCVFGYLATIAQDTTAYEIATDRPSVSFSVATAPKNTLIAELGYLQFNQQSDFSRNTSIDPNISLRYGITKRLETRLGEEFLANRIRLKVMTHSLRTPIFYLFFWGKVQN
ncbi:MAG: hypothetical protein ACK40K_05840 [Raineya sp.]